MWRLDVSSEAELDIFEATLRYERERADLGFRFEAQVNKVFARLVENPFQFPAIEETLGGRSCATSRTASSLRWKATSLPFSPSFICIGILMHGSGAAHRGDGGHDGREPNPTWSP